LANSEIGFGRSKKGMEVPAKGVGGLGLVFGQKVFVGFHILFFRKSRKHFG
jgi:hypothetical protein